MILKKPHVWASALFLVFWVTLVYSPSLFSAPLQPHPLEILKDSAKTPAAGEIFGWELTDGRVVNPGAISETEEGILISGYTIEAFATAEGRAPLPYGNFRVTLTAFRPRRDMPGQKAGRWYVRGSWSITREEAPTAEKKMRYSPAVVKGRLLAELPFDPTTGTGTIRARLRVPRLAKARGNGKGTFLGNQLFEGRIQMALQR